MFGSGKLKEMEAQLTAFKGKLESAVKEKLELTEQLKKASEKAKELEQQLAASRAEAEEKIAELRRQLEESEGEALKEQARQTIVEYEGLKELYVQKNQEIDSVRESTEEGFAREAATKRHELEEEIATNRADNEVLVSQTVHTFAGSYQYYLDQVRGLMDALSRAAQETGASLFDGDMGNIKERFGAKILEHLQENTDTLRQDSGDLFLIGKEEECEKETPEEEACEKETPEEDVCGQEANEAACRAETEVEEAPGAGEEDGEDEDDDSWEEDGDYEEDEP
ncbi:MAG: hypothetical protein II888_01585 [Clostridia bacterium]|nr:hypothetical protein [Clostridia bacterium]